MTINTKWIHKQRGAAIGVVQHGEGAAVQAWTLLRLGIRRVVVEAVLGCRRSVRSQRDMWTRAVRNKIRKKTQ